MRFQIKDTQYHLDLLTLLFPCAAAMLGEGAMAAALVFSLATHEFSHLLCARLLHISIPEVRLTPFGGLAQTENPYLLSAPKLCILAAAGPTGNFILILLLSAMCHWNLISPETGIFLIRINTILMLFNLLPALPLDGGRILFCVLCSIFPRGKALETGIWAGRILAGGLILLSLWGFHTTGKLNLSPLFAALFLIVSACDERRALADSRLKQFLPQPLEKPVPAAVIAADTSVSPEILLRAAVPGYVSLFALFEGERLTQITDKATLLDRLESP